MNASVCRREDELLDALGRGYVGPELTAHVDGCPSCSELRLVAGALLDDRREAITEAHVPSAGAMWFRMQMRHRREAQATARRSLLVGQALTVAVAIALLVTLLGADVVGEVREMRDALASVQLSTKILIVLAAWALVTPIAGFVAVRQK